ncbi:hypothetical protein, partial [Bradyrhizobium sp. sBnM-33]
MEAARYVAECQVQLERVKNFTAQTIRELICANLNDQVEVNMIMGQLKKLESYERKARSLRVPSDRDRAFRLITTGCT